MNDKKLARWVRRRILQCKKWEREAKAELDRLEMDRVHSNKSDDSKTHKITP